MSRLPSLKPAELVSALKKLGFAEIRQKGSHKVLAKGERQVVVPMHSRELRRGTLARIVKDAGYTPDDFAELV